MKISPCSFTILCFLAILHSCFSFPTNDSTVQQETAKLSYIKEPNYFDDEFFLKKVQKYTQNDTENEPNAAFGSARVTGVLKCSVCKLTLKYALWKYRKPDGTYDGLPEFVGSACKRLKIETDSVCNGIVTTYKEVVLTLLHKLQLSAEQVCGLILPTTCYAPDLPWNKIKWNVQIPGKIKNSSHASNTPTKTTPSAHLRVLHLSDIHIDLQYTPGAPVDCVEPLCCRHTNKMKAGSRLAGYWGSLGYCDTPYWTLENLLQHVSQNKYDYIIWTGDLPAHNDWNQSRGAQTEVIFNLTRLFLKYFPQTPIYPSLGNHESFPVNNFPPGYVTDQNDSITWLYGALKKAWEPWLPADALETVSQSGCYTTLAAPKFRIISLNMNYCNQQNWWMLINPVDPNHELQWLVNVLLKAEEDGERVHILGHIPPGSYDCLPIWSHNYYKIVNRFQKVIAAQFFGHTHADQMELFFDEKTKQIPTNIAYIGPSVTTFYNMHPGYREYSVDGFYEDSPWAVQDHFTFFMNLTKANRLGPGQKPSWELEYSAKKSFNLSDLSLNSWNKLVNSWIAGKDRNAEMTFQKYYYYFYKGSPPAPSCDAACKKSMLCDIRSARSGDSEELCSNF